MKRMKLLKEKKISRKKPKIPAGVWFLSFQPSERWDEFLALRLIVKGNSQSLSRIYGPMTTARLVLNNPGADWVSCLHRACSLLGSKGALNKQLSQEVEWLINYERLTGAL